MSDVLATAVLVLATLAMGLFAGLFYTYATSIMVGLRRTEDRVFVSAMQWFNATIGNAWFAFSFIGSGLLTIVALVSHLGGERRAVLPWIIAGLVGYLATVVITVVVHVPLNNALAAAGEPDRIADVAAVRRRFEARWVQWNVLRAVTSAAALACLVWALVLHGRL